MKYFRLTFQRESGGGICRRVAAVRRRKVSRGWSPPAVISPTHNCNMIPGRLLFLFLFSFFSEDAVVISLSIRSRELLQCRVNHLQPTAADAKSYVLPAPLGRCGGSQSHRPWNLAAPGAAPARLSPQSPPPQSPVRVRAWV